MKFLLIKSFTLIKSAESMSKDNLFLSIQLRKQQIYSFIQNEGDTVFVPEGYRHAVLNLETSVAITHNFVKTKDKKVFLNWIDKNKLSLDMDSADFMRVKDLINKNFN